MTALPTNFSASEVEPILRRINPKLAGQIRSLFVCLSDDHFNRVIGKFKNRVGRGSAPTQPAVPSSAAGPVQPGSSSSSSDEEDEEGGQAGDTVPIQPPPTPKVLASKQTTSSGRSGRGPKRGASTERGSSAKK